MPRCSKCGSKSKDQNENDCDHEVYLTTASSEMEAKIIESLLNLSSIPILKKYRESGDYMSLFAGTTNFGIDIFVPSRLLSTAQEILQTDPLNNEEDEK